MNLIISFALMICGIASLDFYIADRDKRLSNGSIVAKWSLWLSIVLLILSFIAFVWGANLFEYLCC